jgi:5-methylcytosine-specific restriction endonuclease McrA
MPFKTKEDRNAYQREWNKNYRKKHPLKTRKRDREASKKYRQTDEWREYQRDYFRDYFENPVNKKAHTTRTAVASIKNQLKKGKGKNFHEETNFILSNCEAIGWTIDTPSDLTINHICPLVSIYEFNIDFPKHLTFTKCNIELIPKSENSSKKNRVIKQRTLKVAERLEKLYPQYLTGFTKWLEEQK